MMIVPEGVPVRPYIVWGIGLHGSPSRVQAQESYLSISWVVSYYVRLVSLLYEQSYHITSS
jgi:hypothetical protein